MRIAGGYAPKMEDMAAVQAVELALRGNKSITDEGKRQIVDYVKEVEKRYGKQDASR